MGAAIDALADQKRAVREAAHRSLEAWASRRDDVYGMVPSKRRREDDSPTSAAQRCSGMELVLPAVPPSLRKKPAVRGPLLKWLSEKLKDSCILTENMRKENYSTEVPVVFAESVRRLVSSLVPCLIDRIPEIRRDASSILTVAFECERERTLNIAEKVRLVFEY